MQNNMSTFGGVGMDKNADDTEMYYQQKPTKRTRAMLL